MMLNQLLYGVRRVFWIGLCVFASVSVAATHHATPIRIAVASNFATTLNTILTQYKKSHPQKVELIVSSTGKLFAQIQAGLNIDIFLAADKERPMKLFTESLEVDKEVYLYALGRLALWSNKEIGESVKAPTILHKARRIALAKPQLAPYGQAAQAVLKKWELWDILQSRYVFGENVQQVYQYMKTQNVEAAFVALSLVLRERSVQKSHYFKIPESWHPPIEQYMVRLTTRPEVQKIFNYLKSAEAKEVIIKDGYGVRK
ncbi:MAG: molybdate ABC transporter substrate-binding protein [Bdellovibrionales bacterium]|nr:molybdate ABC transporter substrate-binding protein [Bdellovibrionales bacterium]